MLLSVHCWPEWCVISHNWRDSLMRQSVPVCCAGSKWPRWVQTEPDSLWNTKLVSQLSSWFWSCLHHCHHAWEVFFTRNALYKSTMYLWHAPAYLLTQTDASLKDYVQRDQVYTYLCEWPSVHEADACRQQADSCITYTPCMLWNSHNMAVFECIAIFKCLHLNQMTVTRHTNILFFSCTTNDDISSVCLTVLIFTQKRLE